MAHPEQRAFFEFVRHLHPWAFHNVRALDCGSLDVNGSLRDLFTGGTYIGIDVVPGRNVLIVLPVHEFGPRDPKWAADFIFDTVVSAEMLEHDPHWRASLLRMYELLKPGGLLVISCAAPGRPEHGTRRTGEVWTDPANPDYYRNVSADDIRETFMGSGCTFKTLSMKQRGEWPQDTYVWGIKTP